MNHSNQSLNRQSANNKAKKRFSGLASAVFILAILGFADATYLSFQHFTGQTPVCTLVQGCEIVTTSAYSVIFGIPVAVFGVLYYFGIAAAILCYFTSKKEPVLRLVAWCSIAGLLASAWFVYLQLFVIHAICLYCIISAASSTLIFILGMVILRTMKLMPGGADAAASDPPVS